MKKLTYLQAHKNKIKRKDLGIWFNIIKKESKTLQLAMRQNVDGTLSGFRTRDGNSIILIVN